MTRYGWSHHGLTSPSSLVTFHTSYGRNSELILNCATDELSDVQNASHCLLGGVWCLDFSHRICLITVVTKKLHCIAPLVCSHCESWAMQLVIVRPIHCFTAAVPESLHVPIVPVVLFNISYLVNSTSAPHPPGSTLTFQYTHLVLGTYMHLAPENYMHLALGTYMHHVKAIQP